MSQNTLFGFPVIVQGVGHVTPPGEPLPPHLPPVNPTLVIPAGTGH